MAASSYNMIGLMSGTSLDGLDIIAATFREDDRCWRHEVVASQVIPYDADMKFTLREAHELSLQDGISLHAGYGKYLGERVNEFIGRFSLHGLIDCVVSHGHTVLHAPGRGYTFQLGDGAALSAVIGLPVISDLRSADVALGGQGAPIVPVGEKYLFPEYRIFVNIGGIANISFHGPEKVIAYDVCPGNTPLNLLALLMGSQYDDGGTLARKGRVDEALLSRLGEFSFYGKDIPRSLHTYQIANEFMPVLDLSPGTVNDKLRTVTEHIAAQIAGHIEMNAGAALRDSPVMLTGGGALNNFLVERIRALSSRQIDVPARQVVEFKEALVMAFLGVLRMRGHGNCLASVTGASRDSCGGAWYAV